ncbi:SdpI family protein [Altererythrobacter rubellus]|uniref:SdpI family protein n=1 Tax=Altererythrobacter rubellus TaxID=2173831 RepID=UPI003D80B66A
MKRQNGAGSISYAVWVPLLLAVVCLPLTLEMIGPNSFYGVRTTATLESTETWYRSNFYAGLAGVLGGLIGALLNIGIVRSSHIPSRSKRWLTLGIILAVAAAIVVTGLISI